MDLDTLPLRIAALEEKLANLDMGKLGDFINERFSIKAEELKRELTDPGAAKDEKIEELEKAIVAERETRETVVAELQGRIAELENARAAKAEDYGSADDTAEVEDEPTKRKKRQHR